MDTSISSKLAKLLRQNRFNARELGFILFPENNNASERLRLVKLCSSMDSAQVQILDGLINPKSIAFGAVRTEQDNAETVIIKANKGIVLRLQTNAWDGPYNNVNLTVLRGDDVLESYDNIDTDIFNIMSIIESHSI